METNELGRLAGVVALTLDTARGPRRAFIVEHHRQALPCWHEALAERPTALLITFDRHLDLAPPPDKLAVPERTAGLRAVDDHARWELDTRNIDHILAAIEAGLVGDALLIARHRPAGAITEDHYIDRRGERHRLPAYATLDRVLEGMGVHGGPASEPLSAVLHGTRPILLDFDLDCFTTQSDAEPTTVVRWPRSLIREFLIPRGAEAFWREVLPRTVGVTIARESLHCGGVLEASRVLEDLAQVLFVELLGADLP